MHGLDASGLTTPNLAEAATDRALMACAAATTVLADHTKWGVVGLARIAPLDDVDTLLTRRRPARRRTTTPDRCGHSAWSPWTRPRRTPDPSEPTPDRPHSRLTTTSPTAAS